MNVKHIPINIRQGAFCHVIYWKKSGANIASIKEVQQNRTTHKVTPSPQKEQNSRGRMYGIGQL